MLVLGVDTATAAVTAVLARVDADRVEVLEREVTVDGRAHGERLAPSLDAVLRRAGHRPDELGAVVAGVGPGPFTGLRVGMVTATAMAQALDIPVYGVCSLDAVGGAAGTGRVLVATDARRREVYWAVYVDGVRQGAAAVGAPATVATGLTVDRAIGDGAVRYADVLGVPVVEEPRFPVPEALIGAAAERIRSAAPGEQLEPLYLRRPDVTLPGAARTVTGP
ncbi:MAG: tRNA (adenosine(37)-N6)-threonylcarbamoyltransferase complex dimerization subunit type 1 TsaB [Actinocatenispora sp.]